MGKVMCEGREFSRRMSKGDHTILTYTLAQNISLERTLDCYADDWWVGGDEMGEDKEEEIEDWLSCWRCED